MKFYIASSLDNATEVRMLAAALKAAGHTHTYDWTVHGPVEWHKLPETAQAEVCGVLDADVLLVIAPGGRGTHTELGIGIASGKDIWICAKDRIDLMVDAPYGIDGHPCHALDTSTSECLLQPVAAASRATLHRERSLGRSVNQVPRLRECSFYHLHGIRWAIGSAQSWENEILEAYGKVATEPQITERQVNATGILHIDTNL